MILLENINYYLLNINYKIKSLKKKNNFYNFIIKKIIILNKKFYNFQNNFIIL